MFKRFLLMLLTVCTCHLAHAAQVMLTTNPITWRLQNYIPGNVVVWYTGAANCNNGQLIFAANATQADMNRFWAAVMVAKTTGRKFYVFYEDASAPVACYIASFGLDAE